MAKKTRKVKNKKKLPYLTGLIKKIAPKVGAKVFVEPEWKVVGQIVYKNGVVRSFHFFSTDLNPLASSRVARDKHFAKAFIKKWGYPVAPGQTFFEKSWAKAVGSRRDSNSAIKYGEKMGYPLMVKPNDKAMGEGVYRVSGGRELLKALAEIFKWSKVAIVERYIPGRDYRVIVLQNNVIAAYERKPLSVTGDGKSPISKLLRIKLARLTTLGRDIKVDQDDERIKAKLKSQGAGLKSILQKGNTIFLLDNANMSTGGEAEDVTYVIHPGYKKIATELVRKMGLRICGVDIMVTKGDISQDPRNCKYFIIEINDGPGFSHYASMGRKQRKNLEDMCLKILKVLGKESRE